MKRFDGRGLTRELATPRLYLDYLDPFNCECRAYGRLRDEKCEDLAVRAHGYLLLTTAQEMEIAILARGGSDQDSVNDAPPPRLRRRI